MKVKDLRKELKARNARWTIPAEIPDEANVSDIATKFPSGALTPRPGARTTRFPRMRRVSDNAFFLWSIPICTGWCELRLTPYRNHGIGAM